MSPSYLPLDRLEGATIGPTALVTGGCGYLGRHLVDALVALGCAVRTLDVVPSRRDDVDHVQGDLRDPAVLTPALEGVDVVFHTAAVIALAGLAPRSVRARVWSVNVEGTQAVIDACRAQGVGRLVYTSSANVCIDREVVDEGEEVPYASTWVDLYGPAKAEAERRVLAANDDALRTCALRPGGIWGGGDGGFMIRAFLDQVAAGRFVATIGDGTAVVDNTHVDTLVYAELLAAERLATAPEVVGGRPYFITDDERINGITWFKPITDGLGLPWPRWRLPGRLMYAVGFLGEVAHRLGAPEPELTRIGILKLIRSSGFSVDAARRDLGWAPLVKHEDGLRAHLEDYRAHVEARRAR